MIAVSCASDYLGPLRLLGAPLYMEIEFSPPPLRLWLRAWLRPSLPPLLHGSTGPKGDQSPSQYRLRAWRFDDIPTAPPGQNINAVLVVTLSIFAASLAPDACAIASALAPQRFPITSATGIASVPATPEPQTIITGSRRASGLAQAKGRGPGVRPLEYGGVLCLHGGRPGEASLEGGEQAREGRC